MNKLTMLLISVAVAASLCTTDGFARGGGGGGRGGGGGGATRWRGRRRGSASCAQCVVQPKSLHEPGSTVAGHESPHATSRRQSSRRPAPGRRLEEVKASRPIAPRNSPPPAVPGRQQVPGRRLEQVKASRQIALVNFHLHARLWAARLPRAGRPAVAAVLPAAEPGSTQQLPQPAG